MKDNINIVFADPQPIFRNGLLHVLRTEKSFHIIGEASDGKSALKMISDEKPNIAILAIDLPKMNGIEIARKIYSHTLPVKLIFLTSKKSRTCFNSALNLGVKGYVSKDCTASYLLDAVKQVSEGKSYFCPQLSDFLIKRKRQTKSFTHIRPAITDLTPCEKRILILISQYLTSRQIADELFISIRTVEHHREHISQKLNLHGRYSLLKFAIEHHDELI